MCRAEVTGKAAAMSDNSETPGARAAPRHLGQASRLPASPEAAELDYVPNPRAGALYLVRFAAPEFTSLCPVTGQPDLYIATIEYWPSELCIESKSLKFYLSRYRNETHFCEALAVKIRDDVAEAIQLPADKVRVTLKQKARGGITITATA